MNGLSRVPASDQPGDGQRHPIHLLPRVLARFIPSAIRTLIVVGQYEAIRRGFGIICRYYGTKILADGGSGIEFALYVAHYNLCQVHETLRITCAMALGVTNRV